MSAVNSLPAVERSSGADTVEMSRLSGVATLCDPRPAVPTSQTLSCAKGPCLGHPDDEDVKQRWPTLSLQGVYILEDVQGPHMKKGHTESQAGELGTFQQVASVRAEWVTCPRGAALNHF